MIFPQIVSILQEKGYTLYDQPYQLNIVGIRSKSTKANKFDDEIHVFFKTGKGPGWEYHIYKATTDPGTFWLNNPMQPTGTAILKDGQYVDAYAIGLHQNKYKALVQVGSVTVLRDYDRDAYLDLDNGREERGQGINMHRALSSGSTKTIDKFSAGCQVFENAGDFDEFMAFCERHRKMYGNKFTYTLIDFRATRRQTYRRGLAIAALAFGFVKGLDILKNALSTEEPEYEKEHA